MKMSQNALLTNNKSQQKAQWKLLHLILILALVCLCFATVLCQSILNNASNYNCFDLKNENLAVTLENNDNSALCLTTAKHTKKIVVGKKKEKIWPQKASGAVLLEQSTKRVLANENMNQRCYPASTTKVLTALTVIENCDVSKFTKIKKEAVGVEGSSLYLKENTRYKILDLLKGLMLRSGNDAATQLAIEVSGGVQDFAALMNSTAKKYGAINSNFVNPHGLHDDNHFTTAYDLAMITAAAFENVTFREICALKTTTLNYFDENGEQSKLVIGNKNKLLKMFDGANGVKTGFTKKSGRCLVGSAKKDGMQLISVVLNYNDMWNDTMRLLSYGFENYFMCKVEQSNLFGCDGNAVELKIKFNSNADFVPKAYPIKRDNSEKLVPIFS